MLEVRLYNVEVLVHLKYSLIYNHDVYVLDVVCMRIGCKLLSNQIMRVLNC